MRRQYRPSELEVVVALAADIYSHSQAVKDKDSLIRKVRVANPSLHDPAPGRCSRLDLHLFVSCHSGGLRAMRREAVLSDVQKCLIVPTMSVDESWSLSGSHSEGKIASQQAVSCHWSCKVGKMQLRCGDGLGVLRSHKGWALVSLVVPCQCSGPVSGSRGVEAAWA